MWKPCLPGVNPVTSATTFTVSPDWVKVTEPVTLLPAVGCRTAIAFVGSCAFATQTPSPSANKPRRNFIFMPPTYPANRQSETALIDQALLNSRVGIDPSVTQERPVGPMSIDYAPIDCGRDNFFAIDLTFGDD